MLPHRNYHQPSEQWSWQIRLWTLSILLLLIVLSKAASTRLSFRQFPRDAAAAMRVALVLLGGLCSFGASIVLHPQPRTEPRTIQLRSRRIGHVRRQGGSKVKSLPLEDAFNGTDLQVGRHNKVSTLENIGLILVVVWDHTSWNSPAKFVSISLRSHHLGNFTPVWAIRIMFATYIGSNSNHTSQLGHFRHRLQ